MGKTNNYTFRVDKVKADEGMCSEIVGALCAITNPRFKKYEFAIDETATAYDITLETTKKLFVKALTYCMNIYPGTVYVKL